MAAIKKALSFLLFLPLFFAGAPSCAESSRPFRFAVMGCAHPGVCGSRDFKLAVSGIREQKPDFVLFLGGMVDLQTVQPVEDMWREFDRITSRLGAPVYDVPGDCGLAPLSVSDERKALEKRCFTARYKKPYYSFRHGNSLFIGLDSGSLVEDARLDFLKKAVSASSKYDNVFIFVHDSGWSEGENGWWLKNIHPLIKGKVKYVFGAGRHNFDVKKIDDVTYVTSGTPPCLPPPVRPGFPNFLIGDVRAKEVSVKVMPVKPVPVENLINSENGGEAGRFTALTSKSVRLYRLSSPERTAALQPERVIEAMNIRPGMNILDIGAGTGFFTFPFAAALKGTGKIYATDVDPDTVDYLRSKASLGGYNNIFPAKVQIKGLDPFYEKHSYDIIFLSGVYDSFPDPEAYFTGLRPLLSKNDGRLFIIHAKNVSEFSEMEFDDFRKVVSTLRAEGEKFPVFQRLGVETREFIRNWSGEEIPPGIREALIADFNKMLSDRWLMRDLSDYYNDDRSVALEKFVDPLDARLVTWLIMTLDEGGVFNKRKEAVLDDNYKRQLQKLNRVLITGIFKSDKLYWITTRRVCVEKNSIILTLNAAGYELVREHDFLTHHYFLEFKRNL